MCRRSSYQPNLSDCTHAACETIVKPLSAFCLCARSDAKPSKALSPVIVIPPCRIKVVRLLCKNHRLIQIVPFTVESVLSYGSEVWGFHEGKDIENVHTKFCKQILCVKRSTNSIALYGELGRIPLWYIRKIRMVKYWLNILSNRNSLMYKFYEMLHNDLSSGLTYEELGLPG